MSVLLSAALLLPLVWAASSDLRDRRIPDAAVLAVALAAVLRAACDGGLRALPLAEALLVFCGGALLFSFGLMGGGDVKLLAACALLFPDRVLSFLVLVSLAGALLAVCYLLRDVWRRRAGREKADDGEGIPYGVAVAAGAALELGNMAGWAPARP